MTLLGKLSVSYLRALGAKQVPKPSTPKYRRNFYCAECGQIRPLVALLRPAGGYYPICADCLGQAAILLADVDIRDKQRKAARKVPPYFVQGNDSRGQIGLYNAGKPLSDA